MGDVAAIILAAGRGIRFGSGGDTSKVLAPLDGTPLVGLVAEAALASRCVDVIVVTGHAAVEVTRALCTLPLSFIHNPDFATGMASSLQAGIGAVSPDARGVVVLLGDMPLITPSLIDSLIALFEAGGCAHDAVVPARDGLWGNPVLLGRALFGAIIDLHGDQGARKLLLGRNVLIHATSDEAISTDVDTTESLNAIASLIATASKRAGQEAVTSDETDMASRSDSASNPSISSAGRGQEK